MRYRTLTGAAASRQAELGGVLRAFAPGSRRARTANGPEPDDVAATVEAAIAAGAVGANLEDRPGPGPEVLRPIDSQCERLTAARDAADRSGMPFVINARTDVYLAGVGEPAERETLVLERAARYAEAGADCVSVPGLSDLDAIARLVTAAPVPVNVLRAPGAGVSIAQLAQAGVRRISTGHLIGDDIIDLQTGDTATFQGSIPHRLRNTGRGPLTAISAITPPSF